jgi:hypothetical protein
MASRCSGLIAASPLRPVFFPPLRPSATAAASFRFAIAIKHKPFTRNMQKESAGVAGKKFSLALDFQ